METIEIVGELEALYGQPGETSLVGELDRLPTPGRILAVTGKARIDGAAYDAEWPERAKKSMW